MELVGFDEKCSQSPGTKSDTAGWSGILEIILSSFNFHSSRVEILSSLRARGNLLNSLGAE